MRRGQGGDSIVKNHAVAVELLGTALTTGGVGSLMIALILRLLYGGMIKTQAVLIEQDGKKMLRWYDTSYTIHETPYGGPVTTVPGQTVEIPIYYSVRKGHDWQIRPPHRGLKTLTVLGFVLTGMGVVLPFFIT